MKKYTVIFALVIAIGALAFGAAGFFGTKTPGEKVCTMEAKVCPDGSAVGRMGLNCKFAPCPKITIATTTSSIMTGIRGIVSLGPTCPVERIPPDPQCADKPYTTSVVISYADSKVPFIIGSSNTNGTFQFSVPAGKYTLIAGGTKMLPRCTPVKVTVGSNGYVTANISCDTGIR
jgi:hypothetical protein